MAKELIVVSNPARRRRRRQSAKQRAASLRNLRKARSARKSPRRRRRNPARALAVRRNSSPPRRRNRIRRSRSARKLLPANMVQRQLIPAAIGGAGAVANDVLYSFLPLPDALKVGQLRHVGKAASALLLAFVSSMVVKRSTADQIGAGTLIVVGYNVVKEIVGKVAPTVPMGEYLMPGLGYMGAGLDPGAYLDPAGMGEYLPGGASLDAFAGGSSSFDSSLF